MQAMRARRSTSPSPKNLQAGLLCGESSIWSTHIHVKQASVGHHRAYVKVFILILKCYWIWVKTSAKRWLYILNLITHIISKSCPKFNTTTTKTSKKKMPQKLMILKLEQDTALTSQVVQPNLAKVAPKQVVNWAWLAKKKPCLAKMNI